MYHYAGNNPVKYVDPEGRSPKSALNLIKEYRNIILEVARKYDVDPVGIASVIFQEKYMGVFADLKDALAFMIDGGVNDKTPATRSYGLAEMQLCLAADLLGIDINKPGGKAAVYEKLMDPKTSIILIALYIKRNESELGFRLEGFEAGFAHNMGAKGYALYLKDSGARNDGIPKRSMEYQQAIRDALSGKIDPLKDGGM